MRGDDAVRAPLTPLAIATSLKNRTSNRSDRAVLVEGDGCATVQSMCWCLLRNWPAATACRKSLASIWSQDWCAVRVQPHILHRNDRAPIGSAVEQYDTTQSVAGYENEQERSSASYHPLPVVRRPSIEFGHGNTIRDDVKNHLDEAQYIHLIDASESVLIDDVDGFAPVVRPAVLRRGLERLATGTDVAWRQSTGP